MVSLSNDGEMVYDDPNLEQFENELQKKYETVSDAEFIAAGVAFIEDNKFHSLQEMAIRYPESMEEQTAKEYPLLSTDEIGEQMYHELSIYANRVNDMNNRLANENYMFHSSVIKLQQIAGTFQHQTAVLHNQTATLQDENAKLKELLMESQRQQRLLKEQSEQKPREGPDKDPMWADTEEQHAYLVTPKTLDRRNDIRNPDMPFDEVYTRCVPAEGTEPELSRFVAVKPHWKLAATDGARRFDLTTKDMIVRKFAQKVKPGTGHLFIQDIYKTPPENGEQDEPIYNFNTGYAMPFLLQQDAEEDLNPTESIWTQIRRMIEKGVQESDIFELDERGWRKFEPLARIEYLRNL